MHYDNGFEILLAVVFAMSPQLGVLGPKAQDFVTPFCLSEVEPISDFHLIALVIRSELVLIIIQTGNINNLIGKYIMELSKIKHLQ